MLFTRNPKNFMTRAPSSIKNIQGNAPKQEFMGFTDQDIVGDIDMGDGGGFGDMGDGF